MDIYNNEDDLNVTDLTKDKGLKTSELFYNNPSYNCPITIVWLTLYQTTKF